MPGVSIATQTTRKAKAKRAGGSLTLTTDTSGIDTGHKAGKG